MVLAEHGINREIGDLVAELRTTDRGTSLLDMRLVSTKVGLPARSWRLGELDLCGAPLPAIAFVYGDHFVVIRQLVAPDLLEVDDPALGRLRWPVASFCKVWSGEILIFDSAWSPI
jgi:ABC-type bacteriocin/lantibiotic exporter with double-glycine peptidase domain